VNSRAAGLEGFWPWSGRLGLRERRPMRLRLGSIASDFRPDLEAQAGDGFIEQPVQAEWAVTDFRNNCSIRSSSW
jgi:hypothetical protein